MSIIIKSKARVFGEYINSNELLLALKSKVFTDENAPIQLFTQFNVGFLKLVYLCPYCASLHLASGEDGENIFQQRTKSAVVYINHTTDGKHITKQELIALLEQLQEVRRVCLENVLEMQAFSLTEIVKCDSCEGVHLDCSYNKDCLRLN